MMLNSTYIGKNGLEVNHQVLFRPEPEMDSLKSLYQQLELEYPKFYKMDRLAKMATLAVEVLLREQPVSDSENLSLIFANSSASEETDQKFIQSYSGNQSPSPALFVYTLPNIVTGELSIRHKWYGENCFFILPELDAAFFVRQMKLSFQKGNNEVLVAWDEANSSGKEECFVFLVTRDQWQKYNENEWINVITDHYNNYHHE